MEGDIISPMVLQWKNLYWMMLTYAVPQSYEKLHHDIAISQILKLDVSNGATKRWSKTDCAPSEPVFVPHPEAQNEDDGKFVC